MINIKLIKLHSCLHLVFFFSASLAHSCSTFPSLTLFYSYASYSVSAIRFAKCNSFLWLLLSAFGCGSFVQMMKKFLLHTHSLVCISCKICVWQARQGEADSQSDSQPGLFSLSLSAPFADLFLHSTKFPFPAPKAGRQSWGVWCWVWRVFLVLHKLGNKKSVLCICHVLFMRACNKLGRRHANVATAAAATATARGNHRGQRILVKPKTQHGLQSSPNAP